MLLCVTTDASWSLGLSNDFVFPNRAVFLQYCNRHWMKHTGDNMDPIFKSCGRFYCPVYLLSNPVQFLSAQKMGLMTTQLPL